VHDVDNPLVVMQLDITGMNAFCSVRRQAHFDVLAEKASTSYDNGNVRDGDMIPCAPSLRKYWGYFQSMQDHASIRVYTDVAVTISGHRVDIWRKHQHRHMFDICRSFKSTLTFFCVGP